MAAICSASPSVASLMTAGDPSPEASLVMPIALLRLACAIRPEYAPRESPVHPPDVQNGGSGRSVSRCHGTSVIDRGLSLFQHSAGIQSAETRIRTGDTITGTP